MPEIMKVDVLYTWSMSAPILATKLYIPPPRLKIVLRPRLIERLNEGLSYGRKLTLISASAGFGKTTLVSEWVASPWHRPPGQVCKRQVAWLSLDEGDYDPTSFPWLTVAALEIIVANFGAGSVEDAPIPSATVHRIDSENPAQRDHRPPGQFYPCTGRLPCDRFQSS